LDSPRLNLARLSDGLGERGKQGDQGYHGQHAAVADTSAGC
jgi:hypothetical protein